MKWLEASVDRPMPVFLGGVLVVLLRGFGAPSSIAVLVAALLGGAAYRKLPERVLKRV